jgi:kynurenine formamidase
MSDPAVDAVIRQVSNWGRWGAEDELGTLNHITDRVRAEAAATVETGQAFSLALELSRHGPQPAGDRRLNPQHVMLQTGTDLCLGVQENSIDGWGYADDMVSMALQCATHWDALAHAFYDYRMYNDRDARLVDVHGAARNCIHNATWRLATRCVLLDVARFLGHDFLALDHAITPADLQGCAEAEGVELQAGDAVIVRTGNLGRARAGGGWERYTYDDEPGLSLDCLPWLHERAVAAVATDTWALEVMPSGTSIMLPIHAAGIVHMGLTLGENFVLDPLAEHCARTGRYAFFFVCDPLPFVGAVGSPRAPQASF